ncbi:MAG: ATP-dependent nuclease [Archangium sp.]
MLDDLPPLTWLVGPNGTGKSRFLRALRDCPPLQRVRSQLVSTDRLSQARTDEGLTGLVGVPFSNGLSKSQLPRLANQNERSGNLIGTVALLHKRPDLRLRVEATLSQLLQRHIKLEMMDGNLIPRVRFGSSAMYPLFDSECHGVLELLVLLTNIYNDDSGVLLIDEPELNLHPQYQAFILDEIRRASSGKRIVLATHSPFLLDIKTVRDLQGVICFHPDFSPPSVYKGQPHLDREVQAVLPRMTEQHRSFFFASRPVFVEGYFDATVITSVQAALGRSAEAAGSCIVPASGKDDAARYLILCNALGKKALFIFDLDALVRPPPLHGGGAELGAGRTHQEGGARRLRQVAGPAPECPRRCGQESPGAQERGPPCQPCRAANLSERSQ